MMVKKLVVAGVLGWAGMWLALTAADATVLCQKKTGALFARDTCKKKETAFDATSLLGTLPSQLSTLDSNVASIQTTIGTLQGDVSTLQTDVGNALSKTSQGTVAGYATVASDGTLAEHYSSTGGTVTSSRVIAGDYSVDFGFAIRPNQPMVAVPRETFGHEVCRVFQGSSTASSVSVFCATADAGSPAADVAFTLVVFN
jgi:hypothetical protein